MKEEKKISVKKASEIMGCDPQSVRIGLQTERLKFGVAIKTGKKNWTYNISPHPFKEYIGAEKYNKFIIGD